MFIWFRSIKENVYVGYSLYNVNNIDEDYNFPTMTHVNESIFHGRCFNTISLLLMNTEYVRFCEFRLNAKIYPRTRSLAQRHFRCSQMQPSDDVLLSFCTFFWLTPSGFIGYHAQYKIISTPGSDTPAVVPPWRRRADRIGSQQGACAWRASTRSAPVGGRRPLNSRDDVRPISVRITARLIQVRQRREQE